jgi:hypothetical protein
VDDRVGAAGRAGQTGSPRSAVWTLVRIHRGDSQSVWFVRMDPMERVDRKSPRQGAARVRAEPAQARSSTTEKERVDE